MMTVRKLSDASSFLSIFLIFLLVIISVPSTISAENEALDERCDAQEKSCNNVRKRINILMANLMILFAIGCAYGF
jgi:hypothetical protein